MVAVRSTHDGIEVQRETGGVRGTKDSVLERVNESESVDWLEV